MGLEPMRKLTKAEESLVEKYVAEAEAGYDLDWLRTRPRGRPPIPDGPAIAESVRLSPGLRLLVEQRAQADNVSRSEVIRAALRAYLGAG